VIALAFCLDGSTVVTLYDVLVLPEFFIKFFGIICFVAYAIAAIPCYIEITRITNSFIFVVELI
jgi:hypothetical protein